ncbi:MAG: Rid family detoxifying hydrolase [Siphonobacter sp.]
MLRTLLVLFLSFGISWFGYSQHKVHQTDQAPAPIGPYSQAIEANGMLFVAGQVGLEPVTKKLVPGGVEAEVPQIMENIKAILRAAQLQLSDIVNTTIYVRDLSSFQKINAIYGKYFEKNFPARTTVGVADLPAGATVEIAVIAVRQK